MAEKNTKPGHAGRPGRGWSLPTRCRDQAGRLPPRPLRQVANAAAGEAYRPGQHEPQVLAAYQNWR